MPKFPPSPVPSRKGKECGSQFYDTVVVEVPYQGFSKTTNKYTLKPLTPEVVRSIASKRPSRSDVSAVAELYSDGVLIKDLDEAIDQVSDFVEKVDSLLDEKNKKAIKKYISNAEMDYQQARSLKKQWEESGPKPDDIIWTKGVLNLSGLGGGEFEIVGDIPQFEGVEQYNIEKIEGFAGGTKTPTSAFNKLRDDWWRFGEVDPPIWAENDRGTEFSPIYFAQERWIAWVRDPWGKNDQSDWGNAFAAYTRLIESGFKNIRCAQEAAAAIASFERNKKSRQISMVGGPKKPTMAEKMRPKRRPSVSEPGFGGGREDIPQDDEKREVAGKEEKPKSNMGIIIGAAALVGILVMSKKK